MKNLIYVKTPPKINSTDLAVLLNVCHLKFLKYLIKNGIVNKWCFPQNGYQTWISNRLWRNGVESRLFLTPRGQNGVLNMLARTGISEITKQRITANDRKIFDYYQKHWGQDSGIGAEYLKQYSNK